MSSSALPFLSSRSSFDENIYVVATYQQESDSCQKENRAGTPLSLFRRRRCALLLPRIRLGDDQTDRMLIEFLEPAFALQVLQMTHDRPSPQTAFAGWIRGRNDL